VYRALLTQELSQLTRLDKESLTQLKPAPKKGPAPAPRPRPEPAPHDDFMPMDGGESMPPPDDYYPADNHYSPRPPSRPARYQDGSRKGP
ncbi:MAG TPA: DNA primase, partial [Alcanivorax sp.]|nr:DNA primase [Alcanivorax sp.]